jgi:hypothetical protein
MGKSVKVHEDTHSVLKELKAQRRSKSLDEVIRDVIKEATGTPVEAPRKKGSADITKFT